MSCVEKFKKPKNQESRWVDQSCAPVFERTFNRIFVFASPQNRYDVNEDIYKHMCYPSSP